MSSRAFIPVSIVLFILLILFSAGGFWIQYREKVSQERFISGFSEEYRGLAKACYSDETSESCCLSSVSTMEAQKSILVPNAGCPENTEENTLRCVGSYTWCEKENTLAYE